MLTWLKDILKEQYTEDTDKKISDEIGKGFVAKADFNALNDTKKKQDEDIKTRDKQLEDLKKVDAEGLKAEIEKLQTENKTAQETYEAKLKEQQIDFAIEKTLSDAQAKNITAVKALLNLKDAELDGKNVKGLDEQIKSLKEREDTKFLFNTQTPAKTQFKGFTPGESSDNKPNTNTQPSSLADAVQMALTNE